MGTIGSGPIVGTAERGYNGGMVPAVFLLVISSAAAALGLLAIRRLRRIRTRKNAPRRWYETRHAFHDFGTTEPANSATWVTSCNSAYFEGVLKLHRSMRRVGSEHPLLCLCTDSTTEAQERALIDEGITTKRVELSALENPYKPKWLEAFVKLQCWTLTEHDKVCWIDSDTLQLRNADELLSVPVRPHGIACAVDHEVFPEPSDRVRLRMIQTGVFVLRPSMETYRMVTDQLGRLESVDGSDQGFLTSYFARSSFDEVRFLSSEYNYMKRGLKRDPRFELSRIKILHFVGNPKPWDGGEPGYERLQRLWDLA